jgi:hypothetical protein
MNPEFQNVKNLLDELELELKLDERTVEERLRRLRAEGSSEPPCKEFLYELMAFAFMETSDADGSHWGTYFCPQMIRTNPDGTSIEYPSLSNVDAATIGYWSSRSSQSSNVAMKARYSDLVWDLCLKCTGVKPSHTFALTSADALLTLVENGMSLQPIDSIKSFVAHSFLE